MKNKKIFLALILLAPALVAVGCGKSQTSPTSKTTTTAEAVMPKTDDALAQDTALNNPATIYCLQENGKFTMQKTLAGTTEGLCVLPNDITCEVWAFYKGDCPAGAKDKRNKAASSTEQATTTEQITEQPTSTSYLPKRPETNTVETTSTRQNEQVADNNGPAQGAELELSVEPGETGEIVASWKTNGLKAPDGFITMLSGKQDITYPAKYSHVNKNSLSRSFTWNNLVAGRVYYFRVCIADGDSCLIYSPVVSATAQ